MGMETLALIGTIIAGVGAATGVATTAHALSKGSPDLPDVDVTPPLPPAPPPVPAEPPPMAAETVVGEAVGKEKRKRASRFGVQQTLLSPLGGTGGLGRSLLGG